MITPAEAFRRFEQRLIPARTTAGANESWEHYVRDMLPEGFEGTPGRIAMEQGFIAGYDAAMARVRRILGEVQTESLRGDEAPEPVVGQLPSDLVVPYTDPTGARRYALTARGLEKLGMVVEAAEQRQAARTRLAING